MCFSLLWVRDLLIFLVVVVAIVALLRLVVPWILAKIGADGGILMQAINIFIWAIVAIAVIYFVFVLISCLLSMTGGMPLFPRGR